MDSDEQLSTHFKRGEFACKNGCGFMDPAPELVAGLEELREAIGQPIVINDACRCAAHNAAVGGAPSSQHLPDAGGEGRAADIQVEGMSAWELYEAASKIQAFRGFGVSLGEYIHVDVRDEYPARWMYDAQGKEIPWAEPQGIEA